MSKEYYIYANDPVAGMRVVYKVKNGVATSLLTQHQFKYEKKKAKKDDDKM